MSENWIILIPEDPTLVPTGDRHGEAIGLLKALAPESEQVETVVSEKVRFVDAGENFQRINCPACNATIDNDWWQDQMSDDFVDAGFVLKPRETPCCKAKASLHELRYDWPQGFAKFSLEAMNPNTGELPASGIRDLESILGCPLRLIYCHI